MSDNHIPDTPVTDAPVPAPAPAESKHKMRFTVLENGTIRADFGDGIEPLTMDPTAVPEHLHGALMLEGILYKLRSRTSKLLADARTAENLHREINAGIADLLAGKWSAERANAAGDSFSVEQEAAYEFRVLRAKKNNEEFTGTLADAAAAFSALPDDKKKQLKALTLYQVALANVKARKASEKAAKLSAKAAEEDDSGF